MSATRIYKTARAVFEEAGLDPDSLEIKGSGKGGAVTKSDAEAFLAEAVENAKPEAKESNGRAPSQAEIVRRGLIEGLTDEEILERVQEAHPDTKKTAAAANQQIAWERGQDTAWWQEYGAAVTAARPEPDKAE